MGRDWTMGIVKGHLDLRLSREVLSLDQKNSF